MLHRIRYTLTTVLARFQRSHVRRWGRTVGSMLLVGLSLIASACAPHASAREGIQVSVTPDIETDRDRPTLATLTSEDAMLDLLAPARTDKKYVSVCCVPPPPPSRIDGSQPRRAAACRATRTCAACCGGCASRKRRASSMRRWIACTRSGR